MKRILPLLLLSLTLAGCVTDGVGSVQGGDCRVFSPPPYAIRGATQHDQDWIDPTIESGVGGCKWARPAPRPAEWDTAKPRSVPVKPKKRSLPARIKARVWPIVVPVTPIAAPLAPEPAAPAPPAPRSAIDELLHPEAVQSPHPFGSRVQVR